MCGVMTSSAMGDRVQLAADAHKDEKAPVQGPSTWEIGRCVTQSDKSGY